MRTFNNICKKILLQGSSLSNKSKLEKPVLDKIGVGQTSDTKNFLPKDEGIIIPDRAKEENDEIFVRDIPVQILSRGQLNNLLSDNFMNFITQRENHLRTSHNKMEMENKAGMVENDTPRPKFKHFGVMMLAPDIVQNLISGKYPQTDTPKKQVKNMVEHPYILE